MRHESSQAQGPHREQKWRLAALQEADGELVRGLEHTAAQG